MGRTKIEWTGSLLLILFIFLGVCFGNANADSFITYSSAHQEFSHSGTLFLKSCSGIPGTAQILETYNVIELINDTVKRSGDKIDRSLLILALVAVVSQLFSNFIIAVNRAHSLAVRNKAVVLNYIHNQDGKKRIL